MEKTRKFFVGEMTGTAFHFFAGEKIKELPASQDDQILGMEFSGRDFRESFERIGRIRFRGESFADKGKRAFAKQSDVRRTRDAEMQHSVFFERTDGRFQFADPRDVSLFGKFGESDVNPIEPRFKTSGGCSARIAVVFFFDFRNEKVDNKGGIDACVVYFEYAKQTSERMLHNVFRLVRKDLNVRSEPIIPDDKKGCDGG